MRGYRTPDLAGFAAAQDRKRTQIGSTITFLWPAVVTFAPGVAVSPTTGRPFDPTVQPTASARASASATAGVFFKAVNRGGAANAEIAAPIGHDDVTRVFLTLASADGLTVSGLGPHAPASGLVSEFIFHGDRFKVLSIKQDEIVAGYVRTLVYGAAIGADNSSRFSP